MSIIFSGGFVSLPHILPYLPEFHVGAIFSVCIIFLVSAAETIGDTSALVSGGLNREIEGHEISGSLACDGYASCISGLFGCPPVTSFSQNDVWNHSHLRCGDDLQVRLHPAQYHHCFPVSFLRCGSHYRFRAGDLACVPPDHSGHFCRQCGCCGLCYCCVPQSGSAPEHGNQDHSGMKKLF